MKPYFHPPIQEVSLDRVMHALSDPCRVTIVRALAAAKGEELACNEISLDISKATRSHHFDVLRASGLIFSRLEGTKCLTSLRTLELNKRFPGLLKLVLEPDRKDVRALSRGVSRKISSEPSWPAPAGGKSKESNHKMEEEVSLNAFKGTVSLPRGARKIE